MGLGHTLSSWCRQAVEQVRRLPDVPRDLVLTAAIFLLAYTTPGGRTTPPWSLCWRWC